MSTCEINTGDANLDAAVQQWLNWDKNEKNRQELFQLLEEKNTSKLQSIFASRLEFGTAGLRGVMGAGPSRMNDVTVIQTSQGLAKYLLNSGIADVEQKGVVLAYDGRHNSERFAKLATRAFVQNGIKVYLCSRMCPTPFLAYGVLHEGAACGIVVTASHNPKDDNGYKVYWENGAQILSPHDKNIQASILNCLEPLPEAWDVETIREHALVSDPLDALCHDYFKELAEDSLDLEANKQSPLKFAYTPVHGVGGPYMAQAFASCQFKPFVPVKEQFEPDPEFSTVVFPNPEEGKSTLELALATGERENCDYVIANDPDADRMAAVQRLPDGKWRVFTGNELGALLGWWSYQCYVKVHGKASEAELKPVLIASSVSSKLLQTLAHAEGLIFEETLTGFKWMANKAKEHLNKGHPVLMAFEEAIGYMFGTRVLDKDGISAAIRLAELTTFLHSQNSSLADQLDNLYKEYGYHTTCNSYFLCYDPLRIKQVFDNLRTFKGEPNTYPDSICGGKYRVSGVRDLTTGYDSRTPDKVAVLPASKSSHMLTFFFENGLQTTLRASGTEPKLKYYTELIAPKELTNWSEADNTLKEMVQGIIDEFLQPERFGLQPRKD